MAASDLSVETTRNKRLTAPAQGAEERRERCRGTGPLRGLRPSRRSSALRAGSPRSWTRTALLLSITLVASCSRKPDTGKPDEPFKTVAVFGGIGDTPGRFTYPRALCADEIAGTLWAIDRSGRVQEIDPKTGRCVTIFKMPTIERGFPVGMTVAPGVNKAGEWTERLLYIADTHNYQVVIVEPPPVLDLSKVKPEDPPREVEINIVRRFGTYGTEPGQFIYPTDVEVLLAPDGKSVERIYVGEYGGNDRVSVFDGDFDFLFSFGTFGASTEPGEIRFNRPQSLEITGDDRTPREERRLVVVDARNHRLGVFTLEGALERWIGSPDAPGKGPGEFLFPWGLELLGDGTALVCEFQGCRVQRIDLETGESLGVWGRPGVEEGELNNPWSMAILGDRVYIADGRNNRVQGMGRPRAIERR